MERDHRFKIVITHALEDGAVAVDGSGVPVAFAGFDAAPFYRHAVGVLSHRLGRLQVGLGVVPPVAGFAGGLAAIGVAGLFPGMPVIIGVAAFHLMRGGGGAPEKSGWELESPFDQRKLLEPAAVVAKGVCGTWPQLRIVRRGGAPSRVDSDLLRLK